MANVTITPLTMPDILFTGRVLVSDNPVRFARVSNASAANKVMEFAYGRQVVNQAVYGVQSGATIRMTSAYTLKRYSSVADGNHHVTGQLLDADNINKAEIRYTLNGKDPSRTKYTIYRGSFTLSQNASGSDNIILKARVYRMGQWSPVKTVEVRIV